MTVPAAAPLMADARRAGEALLGEGVAEVLVYGSVARGDADERSDIDLVAVFADVNYAERRTVRARLEAAAGAAVAWPVHVHVTDRPEWRARVANVTASFEHSISRYAVRVATNGVHSSPRWDKMMEKPMTNTEEALKYFSERVMSKFNALLRCCAESPSEAHPPTSEGGRERVRLMRMVEVCEDSAMTVELCLKALATLHGVHPPSEKELTSAGHDIDRCLALVPPEPRRAVEQLIRRRGLDLASMSNWRILATYPDDVEAVRASADDWAEDYVWTALTVCEHTLDSIRPAGGHGPDLASVEDEWRHHADLIRSYDIHTGRHPVSKGADVKPDDRSSGN
ncbi:MAG: hypothetical protein F4078_03965 [Acidimicrobiia bacterium]|nr:hypothetical protein [Acidimicrobiia bacterium]